MGPVHASRPGSKRAPMAEINVTPLVDVMLVLLIIFMVTAPLLVAGVPITLPDSRAKALDQTDKPVQLSMDATGALFLDDAQISRAELPQRLAEIASKGGADGPQIFLRADRGLDYGDVMAVMGEVNRAGLKRVALVTTEGTTKPWVAELMDRAERAGLWVAVIGHALLFGALSVSLLSPTPKMPPANPPIAVDLVDAKSLVSAAPDAVAQASAPPAPSDAPAEPEAPTPTPPAPKPESRKAAQAPADKLTPQKPRQSRLDSSLASQLSRAASRESANPGTGRGTAAQGSGTPAARTAAQLEASFIQALFSQIKRYWRAPTGVDAELLRTSLVVTLRPDGSVGSITIKSQSGENENNANLKALHAERAAASIRRAAPFTLPPEHYAIWQSMELTFDKRLK